MTVKPWDSPDPILSGDSLYRYVTTAAFVVLEPDPKVDAPPGYDEILILDGEEFLAFVVAQITGLAFIANWSCPGGNPLRMKSETTARRLFPNLSGYSFVGEKP